MEAVLPGEAADEQAMARIQAGETEALGLLFERHKAPLFGYLWRIVGDAALAEDLVTDTFLRVYRYRERYRPGRAFLPWMLSIARNLALGEVRRTRLRRGLLEQWRPADPPPAPSGLQDGVSEAVRAALLRLPEDQRTAVVLREYQGLSYREIGEVLGCSEEAARARAYRARAGLRKDLEAWL